MWESIKNALAKVKGTTGLELPGLVEDLGSISESATTAVRDLTESATGAVHGVATAAETFAGGVQDAAETAATVVESAGQGTPDLFDELFGASPLK
jgi:phage-related tail protein